MTRSIQLLLLAGTLLAGCGRTSLLGGSGGCPAGQARDVFGNCIDIGVDQPDLSRPRGDGPDLGDGGSRDMCAERQEICNNGIDDNCNGLQDCRDPQCSTAPNCAIREICDNGLDDDKNGLFDCKDPACFGFPGCVKPGLEICNNGLDDDNNGLVDCLDPACFALPSCQPHVCDPNNPDCADPACVDHPLCQNLVCKPTVDFGALAKNDAASTRDAITVGTKDVAITPCAPGGAGMVVTQFDVLSDATSVRLDFTQSTGADHVFGLFRSGVNQRCEANPLGCYDNKGAPTGTTTYVLDKGRYYLIIQPFSKQRQGSVKATLTTPPSNKKEICNNGVDDDGNGLIDCADPSCFADGACVRKQCNPDFNVGTLVLSQPPTERNVNFETRGAGSDDILSCAGGGGADRVVQFTLKETAGVLMQWSQDGDHVVELFRKPPAGNNCDAQPIECYDPNRRRNDLVAWGELPAGEYFFIFQALGPGKEGFIDVTLSAYRNRKVELCHNGFDDDGDGLVDCADPDCFPDPGCGAPVCQPDSDLGTLNINGPSRSVTLNTTNGVPNETLSCARGGGKARVIRVNLAKNAGMGFNCQDSTDHVLGLFAVQGPRDACDKLEIVCADHKVIPFGCNYEIPNLQAGEYYVIAQAFQAGKEGQIRIELSAIEDRALEICNNGKDDDGDGFTDCADRKCAVSPYCIPRACKPDESVDPLPTTGAPVFKLVQTAGKQVTAQPGCAAQPGGGNSVVAINLPGDATISVGYAQLGQHVFALYPVLGAGLICDAAAPLGCVASAGMNNSGSVSFANVPAGKYYLVVAANKPGDEGSVSLRFTATP